MVLYVSDGTSESRASAEIKVGRSEPDADPTQVGASFVYFPTQPFVGEKVEFTGADEFAAWGVPCCSLATLLDFAARL